MVARDTTTGPGAPDAAVRCPMCGAEIDVEAQGRLCRSCPLYELSGDCRLDMLLCPVCGYHSLPGERDGVATARAAATDREDPERLEDDRQRADRRGGRWCGRRAGRRGRGRPGRRGARGTGLLKLLTGGLAAVGGAVGATEAEEDDAGHDSPDSEEGEEGRAHAELPFLLSELRVGARARILEFDDLPEIDLQRLVAYGLGPGVPLRLIQRIPAYVVRVRQTEIALESELADAIFVAPDRPGEGERRPAAG